MIIAFLSVGISRLKISENIFSTFPESESFEPLNALLESKNLSKKVVFSLNVENPESEEPEILVLNFSDSLSNSAKAFLFDIEAIRPDIDAITYNYFHENFPLLINPEYYNQIDLKLEKDSIKASLQTSFRQLISPGGSFLKEYILNDPLFISAPFFENLNTNTKSDQYLVEDGILFSSDKKNVFVTAKIAHDLSDSKKNETLNEVIKNFIDAWNTTNPNNPADYFGTFEIAANNAVQIQKDTKLTASIALAAVLLILFFFYRKLLIPLFFILPAVFAGLFSLGIMGYVKPEISAISLATAAVILGIVLDYSFHFFTHLRHSTSVFSTVKEISAPLLTGSFTTITAFLALLFANSVVLRDFGSLAALSLFGAVLFTLIGLPVVLDIFKFDYKNMPKPPSLKLPGVSNKFKMATFFLIILITLGFLFSPFKPQFDGDLINLNFHPEALKIKEQQLTGLNPNNEKRLFLFITDKNIEKARLLNFRLFEKLSELKKSGKIISFLSSAQFQIPETIKKERTQLWLKYWQEKESNVLTSIDETADSIGFSPQAFDYFKSWISGKHMEASSPPDTILQMLGLNDLIDHNENGATFINSLQVDNQHLAAVKEELYNLESIQLFDRSEMAASMLDLVKDDFNYILIISALIVFLTLLLIYGRIEMAILAFLPMLMSWIWIVGITGLLGLKFNFVNVVIATFIFGIGDDFSIFTTDGLLSKYKYGKDTLKAYRLAIILSALTTIIGTGVLIFAKHPAIHSIALISVIGLSCILFISLVFQPLLFNLFVQRRIERKKTPIKLSSFLMSIYGFGNFAFGCITLQIVLPFLLIAPVAKLTKARWLNTLSSKMTNFVISSYFHLKKRYYGKENFDLKNPSIIIANHTSFLDILLLLMQNPKVIMMVKDWVYNSPLFGPLVRFIGFIPSEGGAGNLDLVRQRIKEGFSIVIFPEGTRSRDGKMGRFHKGAFYLAQELNLDITPVLISGPSYVLPRNEYYIKQGSVDLKFLPRIKSDDLSWGKSYQDRTKAISKYFKKEFRQFESDIQNASYLFNRIFNNYVFKGPVLEWYLRIKWKLESSNYDYYDQVIAQQKNILDLGCGYGFLSLFLHYRDQSRTIKGIDYDEEKIRLAQNCFDKTDQLLFEQGNIKNISIQNQDVVFLNDVLHYLSRENQKKVLQNVLEGLNENGIIFIRDGITDFEDRHKATERSEWFSTKLLGFNKTEDDFCFLTIAFIKSFAEKNNLDFELKEHSSKTSNVLFVLKKYEKN